jgi:hypothetical protein
MSTLPLTWISTSFDMLNNIKFYRNRPARRILIFPCNIRIHTSKNYRDNLCFLSNRLLFQGPLFFLSENDTFSLEVYTSPKEQYQVDFVKGALKQCKVTHKAEQGASCSPRARLSSPSSLIAPVSSSLPTSTAWRKATSRYPFETWSKLGLEANLANMGKLAGTREAFTSRGGLLRPVRQRASGRPRSERPPLFSRAFTCESYAPHNFGKLLVSHQERLPGKYLVNKVSALALVELGSTITKYAELVSEFDQMNVENCTVLSPLGFIYSGSLNYGALANGKIIDAKGRVTTVFKDHFSSGECIINDCNMLYKGELTHNKKEGVGLLYKETRRDHLTESTRDPSKEDYKMYLYSGEFADDFPHGRGKLYKANKKIFFMGIFRRGNPVYGMYLTDEGFLDGRLLVKTNERLYEEVPRSEQPYLNFVFNPTAKALTTYIYGFRDSDDNSTVLAMVSKDKDLRPVVQNKNECFLTRDVIFYGLLNGGHPSGKGKLLMPDGSKLLGHWNSKERAWWECSSRKSPSPSWSPVFSPTPSRATLSPSRATRLPSSTRREPYTDGTPKGISLAPAISRMVSAEGPEISSRKGNRRAWYTWRSSITPKNAGVSTGIKEKSD